MDSSFVSQHSKVYATDQSSTCKACNATPDELLQYRDLIVYILKNMPTTPKSKLSSVTWSHANTIFGANIKYIWDQADQLFEVWVEVIRKDIITDVAVDFLQNITTAFRSSVYIRDHAKIKILDDIINDKANRIIVDGRWDDDIPPADLEKIKSYILNSKIFTDIDIKYWWYADMIKFLYNLNTNIKTWISMWTMSTSVGTRNIIATLDQDRIKSFKESYSCVRWALACNSEWSSFVSNLNWVGKKVTSNRKSFSKRIQSSAKKLKKIKFKWYFDNTELIKTNIDITNPFASVKKDLQDANVLKKQIYDVLGSYSIENDRTLPCLWDNSSNLNEKDASLLRSICNNMMDWTHNIIQSAEKADIYGVISDPRTTTKLFIWLSQKVNLARWDNQWWVAGVTLETEELCTVVCSNLNDRVTCRY